MRKSDSHSLTTSRKRPAPFSKRTNAPNTVARPFWSQSESGGIGVSAVSPAALVYWSAPHGLSARPCVGLLRVRSLTFRPTQATAKSLNLLEAEVCLWALQIFFIPRIDSSCFPGLESATRCPYGIREPPSELRCLGNNFHSLGIRRAFLVLSSSLLETF